MADDTIFALSSGSPPAAIAIVRISGPCARDALVALAGTLPTPRDATLRALHRVDGELLDRALLLWFPGPGSATGEDLAELHLHGGRAVTAAVLAALAALPGCRAATAGEFTRRAFANGRIDLAQAEALGDLLAAETEAQRRQAVRGADGALGREIFGWRERLVGIAAGIEAELDFSDEGDVAQRLRDPRPALRSLAGELARRRAAPPAERLRDGLRVTIAGPPNAGKSSLLNSLSGSDAAIISSTPGTTRDRIEIPLLLDGVALLLTDTAGLHDTCDEIELMGIARAKAAIDATDILLWLGSAAEAPAHGRTIVVHARCDRPDRQQIAPGADVATSVMTQDGTEALRQLIAEMAAGMLPSVHEIALNARHRTVLCTCEDELRIAAEASDLECVSDGVRRALGHLDAVTGRRAAADVLDAVFSAFCVGK